MHPINSFRRLRPSKRSHSQTLFQLSLVFFVLIGLAACASRQMTVRAVTNVIDDGITAFERDNDLDLLEKAFPPNIKLLEILLASDPHNRKLLVLLSRSYASYAFIFFEGRIESAQLKSASNAADRALANGLIETATGYYRKGTEYAIRAIEIRYPDCRRKLANIATAGPFIQTLGKEDLPALFWYGFNRGAEINLNWTSISSMAGAHRVEKAMRRAIELDDAYFYGGAHLVLFTYYAARSPLMGGNPALALEHYRSLKQMHGDAFLLTDLYYARYYLYHRQDREEFMDVLNRLLSEPDNVEKFRLFNQVAKDRARIYLAATDRLFID